MDEQIDIWISEDDHQGSVTFKTGKDLPGAFYRKVAEIDQKTFKRLRRQAAINAFNEAVVKRYGMLLPIAVLGFMLSFVMNPSAAAILTGTVYLLVYSVIFVKVRNDSSAAQGEWLNQVLENYLRSEIKVLS